MFKSNTSHQTELGEFPADWKIERLDSLFTIQQGKQVSRKNREGDNQRPFLRTKNVFGVDWICRSLIKCISPKQKKGGLHYSVVTY